ncbi:glyoxalase superfamily protein [Rhizobium sp. YJ-22]|uniref:glyoxalase superfamily protein n=1 Tax=Rhizobium sp. YJ-22 TaxID=3037556 RepID=UPI0024128189|nr:glyoxalase superfamily protein [Rhizobium sp. YJ-22]MDG3575417.1 glyoxalase superfamily protein [Rhizobium sp. YJ-22]
MRDFRDAKLMARVLRQAFAARDVAISHSEALEIVADQFGCEQWNILSARIDAAQVAAPQDAVTITPPIPIFRIFSVEKAMEFYRDFLGFSVDWEHRFGDNFPLYCQVSRSGMILHLSEHAGDASPGAKAFVWMTGVRAFREELIGKDYRYMKPGVEEAPWGLEMTVTDPFNNRIAFCEKV